VRSNPEALRREAAERAGIEPGRPVAAEQMDLAARLIHGSGDYERIDVGSHIEQGRRIVVIDVTEKPWGPNYLRFGGNAISDFHTDGHFSLILQHTHTWLDAWGAEGRFELQLGDLRRFAASVYQPLGPGSPWFVEALAQTIKSDYDIFAEGTEGFRRTDRVTSSSNEVAATFGRRVGNTGVARVGIGGSRLATQPAISSRIEGTTKEHVQYAWASYNYDTLDDANFPRRGAAWNASATRYRFRDAPPSDASGYVLGALVPVTFGRLTLMGLANFARATDERTGYGLGGLFNLSGTPPGALSGSQVAVVSGLAYYRLGELPRGLGRGIYAGISLEAGNAWRSHEAVRYDDLRKAASAYMGFDTIIGPLYAGWGRTFGGESAFYLFLGRPGNQARSGFH
jgi:NTE family protein